MPTLSVCNISYYQNLVNGRRLQNQKQNMGRHRIQTIENGGSLNFNFISLLNPTVDENWVCRHCLLRSSFKNDAVYKVPIYSNFFCEWQIYGMLPHFLCTYRPSFRYFRLLTLWTVSYNQVTSSFWLRNVC